MKKSRDDRSAVYSQLNVGMNVWSILTFVHQLLLTLQTPYWDLLLSVQILQAQKCTKPLNANSVGQKT